MAPTRRSSTRAAALKSGLSSTSDGDGSSAATTTAKTTAGGKSGGKGKSSGKKASVKKTVSKKESVKSKKAKAVKAANSNEDGAKTSSKELIKAKPAKKKATAAVAAAAATKKAKSSEPPTKLKRGGSGKPKEDLGPWEPIVSPGGVNGMKLVSWNVNGVRPVGDSLSVYCMKEDPDVICLQETKLGQKDLAAFQDNWSAQFPHGYWHSGPKGYAGVALLSKTEPLNVTYGIPGTEGGEYEDLDGRVLTAEFPGFHLVTAYVVNSGMKLDKLEYRGRWDKVFHAYLAELDKTKPVVLCGDLNVAHAEIDLANPKTNRNKTPGFCDSEREAFSALLDAGFVDTWRAANPSTEGVYSYWSYRFDARLKNKGWRLDYFVVSSRVADKAQIVAPQVNVAGSDHCPLVCIMGT